MEVRAHILVRGVVQGVGFRWFAARHAERLGLRGFARNLWSGDVEIEAEGERGMVEELIALLRVGPRSAHVADLAVTWREPADTAGSGFDIR